MSKVVKEPVDKLHLPFGVYDTKKCKLVHIGLYENEAACWDVWLGWPTFCEIDHNKEIGFRVIPLSVYYEKIANE